MKANYWTSDRIMHLIIGVTLGVLLIMLLRYLSDVLLPFFVACLIAYLLQPLVDLNRRMLHCKGLTLPAITTLLEIMLVIVGIVHLFLPTVIHEFGELGKILHDLNTGATPMPPLYRGIVDFIDRFLNPDEIQSMLSGDHIMTIISGGSSILEESVSVLLTALSWLLTLVYILFILIDYPQISRGFKLIVPRRYRRRFLSVFAEVSDSMNHYFRGQGFVALCAAILYSIGFSIVGLPLAIPMGILVGILYMIPYFQYVTLIPVAAICLVYSLGGNADFLSMFGGCLIVYAVSQSLCDYIITPHVMGRELGLNPAVILLSLSVWGALLGIIGMIIALPVTSLIMNYYTRYISEPVKFSLRKSDVTDS